jgi:hypothetical protein
MSAGVISATALEMLRGKNDTTEHIVNLADDIWRPLVAERGIDGLSPPPSLWRKSCMDILANYADHGAINIDTIMPKNLPPHTRDFLKRMRRVTWNRRFFEMSLHPFIAAASSGSHGSIGLGPPNAKVGDVVCILYGCTVPCLLRLKGGAEYEFIGEAYVYSYMDGEAVSTLAPGEREKHEEFFTLV